MTSSQGDISLYGSSILSSNTHATTIIAAHSLVLENFAKIESLGETGTTIVVDHQCSGGGLVMTRYASITTGHAPLRIFSTARSLNSIRGRMNGSYLVEAPHYINTTSERWGMNYPSSLPSSPFTVFHKENGLIQLVPGGITHKEFTRVLINFIGPFTAELFRDLHPYDEYTNKVETFKSDEEPYWIRKRALGEKGEML